MNPFTNPIYNIYESPLWTSCTNIGVKSRIVSINDPPPLNNAEYTDILPKKDLFYIEKYLSDELSKFTTNIHLVKKCDTYGNNMNINNKIVLPTTCNATFKNFSNDSMNAIRTSIKNRTTFYSSQINFSENIFGQIEYADTYLSSKTNINDKKQLCQRLADINQMADDYKKIIDTINTVDNKLKYADDHDTIMEKYNDNLVLRNDLNSKINDLYYQEISKIGSSKLHLDSTVYTSVLWTILATTILFYVFKNL